MIGSAEPPVLFQGRKVILFHLVVCQSLRRQPGESGESDAAREGDLSPHHPDGPGHVQKLDHCFLNSLQSAEHFPVFALGFCVESSDDD
jgi:hypothetical protein